MCCVGREQSNMTNDWVTQKLDLPMRRLGVNKLDLVQMYWNDYGQKGYVDAALYLTDAKAAGKIGAVGLTNFDTKRMAEMVDAGAEISSNQIQFSLLDRRPLLQMTEYCASNGVGLLPYGVVSLFLFTSLFSYGMGNWNDVVFYSQKRKSGPTPPSTCARGPSTTTSTSGCASESPTTSRTYRSPSWTSCSPWTRVSWTCYCGTRRLSGAR